MYRIAAIILVLSSLSANSQTVLKGIVKDEAGLGIPGANVSIEGSYDGTSTNAQGIFSFSTYETGSKKLTFSFVGFKSKSVMIALENAEETIDIILAEEINVLEGVTISAGSFTAGEEKRRTLLKPLDIATTAGATADIAGALNTLPGTQKVGESGRLFVRGGDGNETRTFIDGMVVMDAYGPAAPNTPSRGRFLPFMFKGTSFSTGGYSAEYGQALSSVLVLNSKDKAEINQTDIGLLSVGADVAHTQVWKNSSLSGKIQYTNLRPYTGLINQRIDWVLAPISLDGSAAYRQRVGKDGIFKFFGNFSQTDFSLNNYDIADPTQKQQLDLSNRYYYGNVSYQKPLNKNWSVRSGASYSYNSNSVYVDRNPVNEIEQGIHLKMVFEHSASDRLDLKIGTEHYYRNYQATQLINIQSQSTAFNEPLTALFSEGEFRANKHFVLKAGLRAEENELIHKTHLDPRFSMAYKPWQRGQFSFAYGAFRQTAQNQYQRINNHLDAERAEHLIVNYQLLTDRRTLRIEAYYKKYFNLVKFQNFDPAQLTNTGSGYAKGFEFFWRDSQSIKNIDYWISYSFLDTERDYLQFPRAAIPSFASQHNLSIVYKHFISALKMQLGATYSFSSGRTYFNPNNERFNSDMTPSYQDLSLNIAYLPKANLILYLSCTNLTGNDNIFSYQFSSRPNADGVYAGRAIRQPADRFLFVGVFITLSKNKSIGQLPNL
jgi:hypothetical protein